MTIIAPVEAVRPLAWTAASLAASPSWRFTVPERVHQDLRALEEWASREEDPCATLQAHSVATPVLDELGRAVARELDVGTGVGWIQGLGGHTELALRLAFLKIGLILGPTIDTYGRLYDVRDTGLSYRDRPIPVSQTKESTGMHTDSSGKSVHPRIIGLACVRQSRAGGGSRVVSAAQVHEHLRFNQPTLLERLYRSFIRDVVTPGGDRDIAAVAANRFPVFSFHHRLTLRYMRYWIERGHALVGEPLTDEDVQAFDTLDAALADPANVHSFRMEPGDLLFVDNTTIAHDRDAYEDDLLAPRLMLRLWLGQRAHSALGTAG